MKAKTILTIVLSILLSAEIIMTLISIALYTIPAYHSTKSFAFARSIASATLLYAFITLTLAVTFLPLYAYWLYEKTINIKTGIAVIVLCFFQFVLVPCVWWLLFYW